MSRISKVADSEMFKTWEVIVHKSMKLVHMWPDVPQPNDKDSIPSLC